MTKEEKAAYDKAYRLKERGRIARFKAGWYQENKLRISEEAKKALAAMTPEQREIRNAKGRQWRENNRTAAAAIVARSYVKNIEKKKAYGKKYAQLYPWKKAAYCMKRIATKKNATPKWADMGQIAEVYRKASEMTATTGVRHQVDHIWPLQGEGFVGLHVHWNLQVLPMVENIRKGNRRPDAYCY